MNIDSSRRDKDTAPYLFSSAIQTSSFATAQRESPAAGFDLQGAKQDNILKHLYIEPKFLYWYCTIYSIYTTALTSSECV